MIGKRQIFLLIVTMAVVSLASAGVTTFILYNTAIAEHTDLLTAIARSQVGSIEAAVEQKTKDIYRYSDEYTRGEIVASVLQQVRSGMQHMTTTTHKSFEFTVGRRDSDQIVLLVKKQTDGFDQPVAVSFASNLAELMRLALSGSSGSGVSTDYRGTTVLAAYEFIPGLDLGIVVKVDLAEIQAPYIKAGLLACGVAGLLIICGTILFSFVGGAMVRTLHESERRLRLTLEAAEVVAWEIDPATGAHHESGPVERVYGSLKGNRHPHISSLADRIHIDDRDQVMSSMQSALQGAGQYEVEYRVPQEDGGIRWIASNGTLVHVTEGGCPRLLGTARDITEQKQVGEALVRSYERLILAADAACFGVWDLDLIQDKLIWDDWMFRLYGVSKDAFGGAYEAWQKGVHPDDLDRASTEVDTAIRGGRPFNSEFRIVRPDGEIRVIKAQAVVATDSTGRPVRMTGINYDITSRKSAEEALHESLEVLNAVLNAIPVRVFWKDKNLEYLGCNTQFARDAGFEKPEEIIGKDDFAMGWRDQAELYRVDDRAVIDGGNPRLLFEEPQTTPSGEQIHLLTSKLPLRDAAGEIAGVLGTYYDITAHRKAERDYRMLFREMLDGYALHEIICDEQGVPVDYRFLDVNPAFECMTGLKAKDIVGRTVLEVLPGIERHWIETYGTVALTGRPVKFENYSAELRKHFDVTAFQPVPNQFACIFVDVTETKRLREQEFRAQRLETAGQVAGQVAHDLNNLLTPLLAYPDLIRENLPDNHPSLALLNAIQSAASRIAEINQQLLTLGRRGHFKQDVLNVNTIIGQAIEGLGPLPGTVECVTDFDSHLKNIRGGSAQLHRVIMNLLVNALDAVTHDGLITIKSENCRLEQALCAYTRVPAGDYVKITVADNGCGIHDQVVQRIFDPFFTTKSADQRRGSGMGLSVVDAVIKDHGGYVDLQTRVGHGTSFFLYLPVSDDTVSEQPQAEIPRGCETILVVDDDEMQREVFVRLLTGLGYQVTAAGSGEEALELLTHVSQDMLILDLVMPGGIDGIETFRRTLLINPYQAVIIVTGCVESGNTRDARELWGCTVLSKPVDRKTLALAVRRLLDSAAVTTLECPLEDEHAVS